MSLHIDFAPRARRKTALSLSVWSAVLVLFIAMAWTLTSETEAGLPADLTSMPEEEMQSINSAIDELNFPWLEVLASLESAMNDGLRIVQLDADLRDARLSVQGMAQDSSAVSELPGYLRAHRAMSDVRIVSQSPAGDANEDGFSIRFGLEAALRVQEGSQP